MEPQVLGIFSNTKDTDIGTGSTSGDHQARTYWFARRLSDDQYEVQPLNANHIPSGIRTTVGKGDFLRDYEPEVGYYEKKTLPFMKSLMEKLDKGQEYFEKGDFDKAEKEFLKAVALDEINPDANMGLGSVYCAKKEYPKVRKIMDLLLAHGDAFRQEQSQQFNTFAISLRKERLYDESIRFYEKAIELRDDDENLHFNTARSYYDKGDLEGCSFHVDCALRINPEFEAAIKFRNHLDKLAKKNQLT